MSETRAAQDSWIVRVLGLDASALSAGPVPLSGYAGYVGNMGGEDGAAAPLPGEPPGLPEKAGPVPLAGYAGYVGNMGGDDVAAAPPPSGEVVAPPPGEPPALPQEAGPVPLPGYAGYVGKIGGMPDGAAPPPAEAPPPPAPPPSGLRVSEKPAWARDIRLEEAALGTAIKSGNFGTVHWIAGLDRKLVLKVPKGADAERETLHEAEFYAKVGEHPNIAKCMGIQDVGGQRGLVLEGVEGRDMEDTLKRMEALRQGDRRAIAESGMRRALSQSEFVGTMQYMLAQTLEGLAAMEAAGVVHADIRPANIMCDAGTGAVKIVDFGLATDVGTRPVTAPVYEGSVGPEYAKPDGVADGAFDMFGSGEIARKAMERAKWAYRTDKADGRFDRKDVDDYVADGRSLTPAAEAAPLAELKPRNNRHLLNDVAKYLREPFVAGTDTGRRLGALSDKLEMAGTPEEKARLASQLLAEYNVARRTLRASGQQGAETAYTAFVNWAMNPDPTRRPSPREALAHPFMQDRLLDDEAAQKVIAGVLGAPPPAAPAEEAEAGEAVAPPPPAANVYDRIAPSGPAPNVYDAITPSGPAANVYDAIQPSGPAPNAYDPIEPSEPVPNVYDEIAPSRPAPNAYDPIEPSRPAPGDAGDGEEDWDAVRTRPRR